MNESSSHWPHTGAILAGGHPPESGRAGTPAAMWDHHTMITEVLRQMLRVCPSVVIVGDCRGFQTSDDQRVRRIELPESGTPLSALEALLASQFDTGYLVAACNQPFLTESLLWPLTRGNPSLVHLYLAPKGISFHPFPGYYPASLLGAVRQSQNPTDSALRNLIRESQPLWLPLAEMDEPRLLNLNAAAHLEKLHHLAGHNNVAF